MAVTISAVARELRAARENLGYTREQLAEKINYSAGYIEKIETGKLPVTEGYIAAATTVLAPGIDAGGLFSRLREDERREVVPSWFRPWVEHEQEATEIRWYEPLLVPGLLQTEGYAETLLEDAERVAARLERQVVIDRAALTVVIPEHVLRFRVGDDIVMHEQLISLSQSRSIVHILPDGAGTYLGVDGGFILATVDDTEVGYVETAARGFVLSEPGVLSVLEKRWRALLAEALPRSQSRELILKEAGRWKS